jgi:hypothetical protein
MDICAMSRQEIEQINEPARKWRARHVTALQRNNERAASPPEQLELLIKRDEPF